MKFEKKRYLPVLLVLLLFAAGSRIGAVSAKYVTERTLQSQVTFTAKLAEKMVLEEYKVARTSEGDYEYEKSDTGNHIAVNANSYVLMPGVDVRKDPYIRITNKTPIEAYLFLEIVGLPPEGDGKGVTYQLENGWKIVNGTDNQPISGKNNGRVYVYSDNNGPVALDEEFTKETNFKNVLIIKDGKVNVSQELAKDVKLEIKFYAVMGEVVEGKTTVDTYNDAATLPQDTQ